MDFMVSFPEKRGKGHELSVAGPEYCVNSGPSWGEFPACYDRGIAFILPILFNTGQVFFDQIIEQAALA
jgi:hypothetical protein